MLCALERITPNRSQPRKHFDAGTLEELALSIQEHGLLEPLVVRRADQPDRFELVAGERRWRACQKAGLRDVPVHVLEVGERSAFAEALERLIAEHQHTTDSLATLLKKDRSTLTNALRLLKLPEAVRQRVVEGQLSEGHARAILGAPDAPAMITLAEQVIAKQLSVRQTEAAARALREKPAADAPAPAAKTPGVKDLELRLMRHFGTRCEVRDKRGRGEVALSYKSLDELDGLLERLFKAGIQQ
jgi:ParB family transcriptional regulator, chromosome partitioning protein